MRAREDEIPRVVMRCRAFFLFGVAPELCPCLAPTIGLGVGLGSEHTAFTAEREMCALLRLRAGPYACLLLGVDIV